MAKEKWRSDDADIPHWPKVSFLSQVMDMSRLYNGRRINMVLLVPFSCVHYMLKNLVIIRTLHYY